MVILSKDKFLKLPSGTIYQRVMPRHSKGPLCMKLESCDNGDFWMVELDLVSLLGCSHEQDETFVTGSGSLDMCQESDGMFDDDDLFLCLGGIEKNIFLATIKAGAL
jgi:hypothetical protein